MRTLKDKTEHCLQKWEECRNNDRYLVAAVIATFYSSYTFDFEGNKCLRLKDLLEIPSSDSITRIRRKFQEEGQYVARSAVQQARDVREAEMRQKMVKPISEIEL